MTTYNAAIPQSTDLISNSQAQILGNFDQLNTQFAIDHTAFNTGSGNGDGFHKKATLKQQGSDPTAVALANILYTKSVVYPNAAGTFNELFMRRASGDSSTVIQLTTGPANPNTAANGYTFLPGGLILQWGTNAAIANAGTQNFPIAFPNACLNVTVTLNIGSTLSSVGINGFTRSLFTFRTSAGGNVPICFTAIGY